MPSVIDQHELISARMTRQRCPDSSNAGNSFQYMNKIHQLQNDPATMEPDSWKKSPLTGQMSWSPCVDDHSARLFFNNILFTTMHVFAFKQRLC